MVLILFSGRDTMISFFYKWLDRFVDVSFDGKTGMVLLSDPECFDVIIDSVNLPFSYPFVDLQPVNDPRQLPVVADRISP